MDRRNFFTKLIGLAATVALLPSQLKQQALAPKAVVGIDSAVGVDKTEVLLYANTCISEKVTKFNAVDFEKVVATTLKNYQKLIADNFTQQSPIFKLLEKKSQKLEEEMNLELNKSMFSEGVGKVGFEPIDFEWKQIQGKIDISTLPIQELRWYGAVPVNYEKDKNYFLDHKRFRYVQNGDTYEFKDITKEDTSVTNSDRV